MKKLFLAILVVLPALVWSQTDTATIIFPLDTNAVSYNLDTLSSDSFFLVEVNTLKRVGAPRPLVTYNPIYFPNLAAFNGYIDALLVEADALVKQFEELERQKNVWGYKYSRIVYLRDSVFNGYTGGGPKMATKPIEIQQATSDPNPPKKVEKQPPAGVIDKKKKPSKKGKGKG